VTDEGYDKGVYSFEQNKTRQLALVLQQAGALMSKQVVTDTGCLLRSLCVRGEGADKSLDA
jgi:hypothetical protein